MRGPTGGCQTKNKHTNKGYKQIAGTVIPIIHNFFLHPYVAFLYIPIAVIYARYL
jgi:hypothetical protein